jgi:hypothetical protein
MSLLSRRASSLVRAASAGVTDRVDSYIFEAVVINEDTDDSTLIGVKKPVERQLQTPEQASAETEGKIPARTTFARPRRQLNP